MLMLRHGYLLMAALVAISCGLFSVSASLSENPAPQENTAETMTPEEAIKNAEFEVNRKRYAEAKLILKKAIAVEPTRVPLYMALHSACVKSNDWSDAASSLEKVLELEPARESFIIADYANALFQLHRYDRAKAACKKALSFGKDKDLIHKTLIQIALREKDEPAVKAAYIEYLKVKPGDGDMHWEFANFLYKNGKGLKESLPEYKAASDCRPKDCRGHERYAYLLLCDQSYDGAAEAYIKAIKSAESQGEVTRLNTALKYARQQQKLAGGNTK